MNKIAIALSLLVAVALGIVAFTQNQAGQRATRELQATRLQLEEARRMADEQREEVALLKQRVEKMSEANQELPGLRGEVTSLRQQNETLKAAVALAENKAENVRSQLQSVREAARESVQEPGVQEIALAQAPPHIRNRIAQQYPGATISELAQINEDGRTLYALEGTGANSRGLHAVLDANGEILEQAIEMSFREVPDVVRGAVGRQLGRDGGIDMTQVWEDGQTTYRGNAEQNGQEMQFVFSENGELIRYETWVEQSEQ